MIAKPESIPVPPSVLRVETSGAEAGARDVARDVRVTRPSGAIGYLVALGGPRRVPLEQLVRELAAVADRLRHLLARRTLLGGLAVGLAVEVLIGADRVGVLEVSGSVTQVDLPKVPA